MGLYDVRCSLSGLSLKTARADLVLLRRRFGHLQPIWSPVTGTYNRLGTIDDPPGAAAELRHLAGAVAALTKSGRFVHRGDPPQRDDPFFEQFEPNRHVVKLDGEEVRFALIHSAVVDHIVASVKPVEASEEALFARAFEGLEPLAQFAAIGLGRGLGRLIALRAWLGKRPWTVNNEVRQHSQAEVARFLAEARRRHPELAGAFEGL